MNHWILFTNENALQQWPVGLLPAPVAVVAAPGRDPRLFTQRLEEKMPGVPTLHWPAHPEEADCFLKSLAAFQPHLAVSCGFNRIISREIFTLPVRGTVNIHGGWLPTMRGAHVVNWALIEDRKSAGVTLHRMDEGIDTGPIIARKRIRILESDDARTLRDRLYRQGWKLLAEQWSALLHGTALEIPQNSCRATHYPRRRIEDGQVFASMPARAIHQYVRALVPPWPGAWLMVSNEPLILRQTKVITDHPADRPGTFSITAEGLVLLHCGVNSLLLIETQWQGLPLPPDRLTEILLKSNLR